MKKFLSLLITGIALVPTLAHADNVVHVHLLDYDLEKGQPVLTASSENAEQKQSVQGVLDAHVSEKIVVDKLNAIQTDVEFMAASGELNDSIKDRQLARTNLAAAKLDGAIVVEITHVHAGTAFEGNRTMGISLNFPAISKDSDYIANVSLAYAINPSDFKKDDVIKSMVNAAHTNRESCKYKLEEKRISDKNIGPEIGDKGPGPAIGPDASQRSLSKATGL